MNRNPYSGAFSKRRFSNAAATASGGVTNTGSGQTSFHVTTSANDRSMGDVKITVISEPAGLSVAGVKNKNNPNLSRYTPVGGSVYRKGTVLRVEADPYSGYRFVGWQGTGAAVKSNRWFNVTVNSDLNYVAVFEKVETPSGGNTNHTLRVSWDRQMGKVTANGLQDGEMSVQAGVQVTLTATPLSGYVFAGWGGINLGGNMQTNKSKTITITMPSRDLSLYAEFAKIGNGGEGDDNGDVHEDVPGGEVIGGGGGGGVDPSEIDTPTVVATKSTSSQIMSFVKKWWWALLIAGYVIYKTSVKEGGSK